MKKLDLNNKRRFRAWPAVWFMVIIIIGVAIAGRGWGIAEEKSKQADYFKDKFEEVENKNDELLKQNGRFQKENEALKTEAPTSALPDATFQTLVEMLFPTPESQARYTKIVTTCENSTRDPFRTHTNNDGTIDVGVSQINDKYHADRVEKMFGEPFYKAMTDSVKNVVYAAWLYRQSGNFGLWSCDKLVSK